MKNVARGRAHTRRALIVTTLGLIGALTPGSAVGQTPAATNNGADSIGPAQLRNFSLGKPSAAQPPTPDVPPDLITPRRVPGRPAVSEPRNGRDQAAPAATPVRSTPSVAVAPTQVVAPVVQGSQRPIAQREKGAPTGEVTVALAPANPLPSRPTLANEADIPRISSQPMGPTAPLQQAGGPANESMLPWVIAFLLAAGAALAYYLNSRSTRKPVTALRPIPLPREMEPRSFPASPPATPGTQSLASGGITVKRPAGFPAPEPVPAAIPVRPTGIVSTRLRPWLEIEFVPDRAVVDEAQASVRFDVMLMNSGNAPARNVLVEACMINAGPDQESELRRFFDAPVGAGDRIAAIAPLAKIALKSAVSLPLDQVRAYEVNGRRLFVPLVAFNALYEWSSTAGQTSASFILGRATSASDLEGEGDSRMAPLRLDLGPRIFRGLEGRRHPLAIRR